MHDYTVRRTSAVSYCLLLQVVVTNMNTNFSGEFLTWDNEVSQPVVTPHQLRNCVKFRRRWVIFLSSGVCIIYIRKASRIVFHLSLLKALSLETTALVLTFRHYSGLTLNKMFIS